MLQAYGPESSWAFGSLPRLREKAKHRDIPFCREGEVLSAPMLFERGMYVCRQAASGGPPGHGWRCSRQGSLPQWKLSNGMLNFWNSERHACERWYLAGLIGWILEKLAEMLVETTDGLFRAEQGAVSSTQMDAIKFGRNCPILGGPICGPSFRMMAWRPCAQIPS